MIKTAIVGVKLPEIGCGTGVPEAMGEGVRDGIRVAKGVAEDVEVGVTVGVEVGLAEGVDSKAGPSEAWTTKVRVKVLKIPAASFQEIVIV